MVLLAAALIAAQAGTPAAVPAEPARQAIAAVRIRRATIIDFASGRIVVGDAPAERRDTELRLADGGRQPVKLLEFQ